MKELYPEVDCLSSHKVETESGHSIYFEEAGNTSGIPVIFLHGGPGSACNENHRRYFNPEKYRIILFDQRGCNRSSPNGSVEENTTQRLLGDIEAIRQQLKIDKWILFGGSWGATLALLYTEEFPEYVSGIILRGIFLARQCDFDWFAKSGVNNIFPDYWHEFISIFSDLERDNLVNALHKKVFSIDHQLQIKAAKAWALWAGRIVTHTIMDNYVLDDSEDEKILNEVKIEIHYAKNKYFIKENQILDNLSKISDVPITIIHGRKDLTCLPESSWSVHRSLLNLNRKSKLIMLPGAGHLAGEPVMIDALINATNEMVDLVSCC